MTIQQSVIRMELWNRARWRGVAFGRGGPDRVLFLALVFEEREAAAEIFRDWRARFGAVDVDEQIRVAVIEGDIPGQEPGYTVHVTPNVERLVLTSAAAGGEPVGHFTRQLRMENPKSVIELARFKADVATEPFLLMVAALNPDGSFLMNPTDTIRKRQIAFRDASTIPLQNDVDSIVLARREGAAAAWN